MSSISRFYVYVLARPNGKPFYVGKGSKDRVYDHDREARKGCKCHKCNIVRKIWRNGGKVQRYIVFTTDDEQEAYAYEEETIAMYGLDTLANQSSGGWSGASGVIVTDKQRAERSVRAQKNAQDPEWLKKVSERTKAAQADPEVKRRTSEGLKKSWTNPQARQNRLNGMHAFYSSEEGKQITSARGKKRWSKPGERKRQSDRLKGSLTDDGRQRRSEASKRLWSDPEHRARRMAAQKEAQNRPELRERKSQEGKRRFEDPEYRQRHSEALHQRYENPKQRQKISEANVRRYGYTYTLLSPDGETCTTNNLHAFACDRGLNPSHLRYVVIGRLPAHKGWTGTREKINKTPE